MWPFRRGPAWRAAFHSLPSPRHAVNEDCCAASGAFCAVADGVGGGAFGDTASQALVRHCAQAKPAVYRDAEPLAAWLRQADAVVREAVNRRGGGPGASMLAAAWLLDGEQARLAHVGDCRAYRLRPAGGGLALEALTVDQTYANLGETPPPRRSPDDPARMVGVGAVGVPAIQTVRLGPGELLLLCSDGLHKFLPDAAIAALCQAGAGRGDGLPGICQALAEAAKANGSHDDVSVLLAQPAATVWERRWRALAKRIAR